MSRRSLAFSILVGALAAAGAVSAHAESPLTTDKMIVALRPELPGDRNYLTYVGALLSQGQLPRHLVESTFLWARLKPRYKYRYFRQALILRAADLGIRLPQDNPAVTGTIEGRVIHRVNLGLLKVDTPLPGMTVTIKGTDRRTTTDIQGEFSFTAVPFGVYTLEARGKVVLLSRRRSTQVTLPTPPPSDAPAQPLIVFR